MTALTDVAGFIFGEMVKNAASPTAGQIAGKVGGGVFQPLDFHEGCQIWKAWVGNRKPWDYKHFLKKTYGEWAYDGTSSRWYNFDIWSNLHYGYVGRASGLGAWTLKAGAGAAQYQAGTSPKGYWERRVGRIGDADFLAAFDDPKDQVAIDVGVTLFGTHGSAVTLDKLLGACRKSAADLNTRA